MKKPLLIFLSLLCIIKFSSANTYYIHPEIGDDHNDGISLANPWRSFENISSTVLKSGDTIALAAGTSTKGSIILKNIMGSANIPIVLTSYHPKSATGAMYAEIDARNFDNGIYLENCSNLLIKNIRITAIGTDPSNSEGKKSCGVLFMAKGSGSFSNITLDNLKIENIFFERKGFKRPEKEVKSANGTQSYGWGIRFINDSDSATISGITIKNSLIQNVSHTGIKFTGRKNIKNITVRNNEVFDTGGPGIQFSGVANVHVQKNMVNGSGSTNDSRKWGRGSGLWTWNSNNVLIEKNKFMNAKGPGDSAGVHIDYYCKDVVVQYNLSANNAGGFCEILGDNYNCAYRYNISINDGYRVKGENGAFQEGKIFWLSGYRGDRERRGPFNSYFYNNTIYVKKDITAKIAIDSKAKGVLIANNIFYIEGNMKTVMGDQYKPEIKSENQVGNVVFTNNLFLSNGSWPKTAIIQPHNSIIDDPKFRNTDGMDYQDFIPTRPIIKNKGITIRKIPNDSVGLKIGLDVKKDILGNPINDSPDLGAIELQSNPNE